MILAQPLVLALIRPTSEKLIICVWIHFRILAHLPAEYFITSKSHNRLYKKCALNVEIEVKWKWPVCAVITICRLDGGVTFHPSSIKFAKRLETKPHEHLKAFI